MVLDEIEYTRPMLPFWSTAAEPIQRCCASGAKVPPSCTNQPLPVLRSSYQRTPAWSPPTSTE